MLVKRLVESAAMMMIGDGALAMIEPKRHMQLWQDGPRFWRSLMRPFANHPGMTRTAGAVELLAGIWLAHRQRLGVGRRP